MHSVGVSHSPHSWEGEIRVQAARKDMECTFKVVYCTEIQNAHVKQRTGVTPSPSTFGPNGLKLVKEIVSSWSKLDLIC